MIADDNGKPVETHETEYFKCSIKVWRIKGPYWGSFPWRYSVKHEGVLREFTGVPNYLETKKKALKKAWWRAKWLDNGTYNERYT